MRKTSQAEETTEPVGIVISRGDRDEPTPAVFAYIWGPAPEVPPARAPRAAWSSRSSSGRNAID